MRVLILLACLGSALAAALPSQGAGMPASRILQTKDEGASMVDRLGTRIDTSLTFTDERGYPFALRQLFPGDRPVILLLGYYSCPAMCGQVLEATLDALNEVDFEPGEDYQLLNISIDPRETVEIAKTRKANYLPKFKKVGAEEGWRVCVGDEQNIARIAEDTGFRFYWNEHLNQFAHPPAVIFLTKEGVISRVIVNTVFDPADIRQALVEASQGELGNFIDQVRLNCLTFDPRTNSYSLTAMTILRIGGSAVLALLVVMIVFLLRRERRKKKQQQPAIA